jgi:hypothetical protein
MRKDKLKKRSKGVAFVIALLVLTTSLSQCHKEPDEELLETINDSDNLENEHHVIDDGSLDASKNNEQEHTHDFSVEESTEETSIEDVAAAGSGKTTIIAPGTKGEYTIKLRNLSEVNATYSLALSLADGNEIPVEFRVNGGEWTNDLSTAINGSLPMNANSDSEIKIEWQWPYSAVSTVYTDRTDATDTELGIDGTKSITVNAAITVTQVD